MNRSNIAQETVELNTIEAMQAWVSEMASKLRDREILLLEGPLGAGKTELVKALVGALGGDEIPASPSFALHNIYSTKRGDVDHLDLYRLESEEDLESTGFWDLFEKQKGLVIVEWANRLEEQHLPPYWQITKVKISPENNMRYFTWEQWT